MKEVSNKTRVGAAATAICVTFSIVWSLASYAFSETPQHLKPMKTGTLEIQELSPDLDMDVGAEF
jgi:hypothetical protein